MDQYQKQLITRNFYLQQMGAISLKADRAAKRIVEDEKDVAVNDTVQDVASDDSLSETRPLPADTESSASDCGEPDQLLHAAGGREARDGPPTANPLAAALCIGRKAGAKKKPSQARKQLCPKCKKGFKLRRIPPLHISCSVCKVLIHKRCLKVSSSTLCDSCQQVSTPSSPAPYPSPAHPSTVPGPPPPSIPPRSEQSKCCDEALLIEDEVTGPRSCLPSFQGSEEKFDKRMSSLGFERSPSQPNTLGDGNCGLYALLDQLNLPSSGPLPMFERDEVLFAR